MHSHHVLKHFSLYVGMVVVLSVALWGAGILIHSNEPNDWVAVLFLLPTLVQLWGLLSINRKMQGANSELSSRNDAARKTFAMFYLHTMLFCLVGYGGLSLRYIIWEKGKNWDSHYLGFYSALALALIFLLLIFAIIMTQAIVIGRTTQPTTPDNPELDAPVSDKTDSTPNNAHAWWAFRWDLTNLKIGAEQEPFLTLLFFLTIFLGVSYLFGLALAFHDKGRPRNTPALYMKHLYTPPSPSPTPAPTLSVNASPYAFDFKSTEALLDIVDPPLCSTVEEKNVRQADRREKGGKYRVISDLVDEIVNKTKEHNRIRVEIVGHSDLKDLINNKSYKSNYELAMARAENTKLKILKELSFRADKEWRDIDWTCVSESNEGGRDDRLVEVIIKEIPQDPVSSQVPLHLDAERPDPLNLMDYMYFANYTITTTGYGDIVPITPYAKFICSFANICEVFFMVILFNALLSLNQGRNTQEHK